MMKKGVGKGFCSGILVAALTVGLGVSAMAASRTITVDDNIRITLKAATRIPLQKPFPKPFFIIKTPLSCQICGGVSRPF